MLKKGVLFTFVGLFILLAGLVIYMYYPEKKLPDYIEKQTGPTISKISVTIDSICIDKSSRSLMAYQDNILLKTYTVSLGGNPIGHKVQKDDKRTPEGQYRIKNKTTQTNFHKTLILSYPNEKDKREAKKKGVDPGSGIEIHGLAKRWVRFGKLHRLSDWTQGCIALTNEEVDELYEHIQTGCPVLIIP